MLCDRTLDAIRQERFHARADGAVVGAVGDSVAQMSGKKQFNSAIEVLTCAINGIPTIET